MSRLKEIHDYLINKGQKEDKLKEFDSYSVYLSMEIMEYAHRNQTRRNGEPYTVHPMGCLEKYKRLIGITEEVFCMDKDLLIKIGIPYDGVQEVCLLHDVVEDTDFTLEEIEEIFIECGFGNYFNLYIKDALNRVTHKEGVKYLDYVLNILVNPISSICKMMDLQDNINILTLPKFDDSDLDRINKYLASLRIINEEYHFLEKVIKYRKEFENE